MSSWDDLRPRVLSAVVMLAVGLSALWIGGIAFVILAAAIGGAMIWELARMLDPELAPRAPWIGVMAAAVIMVAAYGTGTAWIVLLAPVLYGLAFSGKNREIFFAYALILMFSIHGLVQIRLSLGLGWVLWLVLVVIASDVCGYFVGKTLGGPRFWPRVSPKKTWSGTVAGWCGAALVGFGFMAYFDQGAWLIPVSALVGFASQMGDAGESAIKRYAGIKDSSNLIPGHGGVMDRFDAMVGAALVVYLIWLISGVPGAPL